MDNQDIRWIQRLAMPASSKRCGSDWKNWLGKRKIHYEIWVE